MSWRIIVSLFLLSAFAACRSENKAPAYESTDLKVEAVTEHTFRHVSYLETEDFGRVGCNGMVVVDGDEALICDTPTSDAESEELINWIEDVLHCKVIGVVVTHFHEDCLGGLAEFHKRGIPSYASFRTIELARQNDSQEPQKGFDLQLKLKIGGKELISEFLGEGHTTDNVVAYFPNEKVLFGGCLIKASGASKGYLGDANVSDWSGTVAAVKTKFPEVISVVPGHGDPGGPELLDYTIGLFAVE